MPLNRWNAMGCAMVCALLLSACGGGSDTSAEPSPSPSLSRSTAAWTVDLLNSSLAALPIETDHTSNPLRGFHEWRYVTPAVPTSHSAAPTVSYQRYQWKDLEGATPGQYTLGQLVADRDAARQQGRKFAFRLRAMRGYDTGVSDLPVYLSNTSTKAECTAPNPVCQWATAAPVTLVPNWNHPYVQARMQALLQAVATALGDLSDIAWIDVGMWGQWGEWHLDSSKVNYGSPEAVALGMTATTNDTKRAIAQMHFSAFPNVQQVMFIPYGNFDTLKYAFFEQGTTTLPVGLRWDCLGKSGFMDQWLNRPSDWALISERWKIAPWVAEFCTFGPGNASTNAATARQQLRDFHVSTLGNGNLEAPWSAFSAAEQADLAALGREAGYRMVLGHWNLSISNTGVHRGPAVCYDLGAMDASNEVLQLQARVDNLGNAPVYEPWQLWLELRNASGTAIGQKLLLDVGQVKAILPGQPAQINTQWPLPEASLGTYSVHLRWARAQPTAAPSRLAWNMSNVESDGSAWIANLRR